MSLQEITANIHHGKNITGFQKEYVVQNYALVLYKIMLLNVHYIFRIVMAYTLTLMDEYFAYTSAYLTVGKLFVEFTYQFTYIW